MLIIRKNQTNNPIATVSMNKTLANPYYLFSFQHIASKERVSFIPQVLTSNVRYDKFRFAEAPTTNLSLIPPQVNFPYLGQYYYSIYEQASSANTNPSLAYNKLESGRAWVIVGNDDMNNCLYEPYISNDEDFAQVIYVSEEEEACINIPTPSITPSVTPTMTPTQTNTPTPSTTPPVTPTMTQTQTNTPTPSTTPPVTPTTTSTSTPTPTPTKQSSPLDISKLYEWWRADTGVLYSGSSTIVSGWTGYYGMTLTARTLDLNSPVIYTNDPQFNGYDSIRFNPNNLSIDNGLRGDYNNMPNGPLTIIGLMYLENRSLANQSILSTIGKNAVGVTNMLWFGEVPPGNGYENYATNASIPITGNTFTNGTIQTYRSDYNIPGASVNFYVSNNNSISTTLWSGTGGATSTATDGRIYIGNYDNNYGRTPRGRWMEFIVYNKILSPAEVSIIEGYFSSRYGI